MFAARPWLTGVKSASEHPLRLSDQAHHGGASGGPACSQDIRKGNFQRVPDPDEIHPKAGREFAGGIVGQLGVISVKLLRMESCQRAGERLIASFSPKEERRWSRELMTGELHIDLDKETGDYRIQR